MGGEDNGCGIAGEHGPERGPLEVEKKANIFPGLQPTITIEPGWGFMLMRKRWTIL